MWMDCILYGFIVASRVCIPINCGQCHEQKDFIFAFCGSPHLDYILLKYNEYQARRNNSPHVWGENYMVDALEICSWRFLNEKWKKLIIPVFTFKKHGQINPQFATVCQTLDTKNSNHSFTAFSLYRLFKPASLYTILYLNNLNRNSSINEMGSFSAWQTAVWCYS